MRPGNNISPVNPLPPVVWFIAALLALPEIIMFFSSAGFGGNPQPGVMRINLIQRGAWAPDFILAGWPGAVAFDQLYRLVTYSFISTSPFTTVFVLVFTLALGKAISEVFRPWAFIAVFLGAAVGGALIYTAFAALPGPSRPPLIGGFPAAYGLIGAFTWLLWMRLKASGDNPARAFALIAFLVSIQLTFALLLRQPPYELIAEFGGFACGFFLCFLVSPGALQRLRRR